LFVLHEYQCPRRPLACERRGEKGGGRTSHSSQIDISLKPKGPPAKVTASLAPARYDRTSQKRKAKDTREKPLKQDRYAQKTQKKKKNHKKIQ